MTFPYFAPKDLSVFLASRSIRLTKRYGQNFLIDRHKAESIVRRMDISDKDVVLEIGPGIGTMTHMFAEKASQVYAVEIDKGLFNIMNETMSDYQNVSVHHSDFLKFDMDVIQESKFKVYSSLPYNVASQIILKLATYGEKIVSMTVMLPDEIVKRMIAVQDTEQYGVFSIFIDTFFKICNPGIKAEKGLFFPVPQVDSRVIELTPDYKDIRLKGHEKAFLGFVSAVFQNRRKYFRKALESALKGKKIDIIFEEYGLTGQERPENVPAQAYRLFYLRALAMKDGQ